ncbi:MAG: RNase adapter RapZ [Brachymonas sp.]|jgi:UPF0042 nucleotide-binding protein
MNSHMNLILVTGMAGAGKSIALRGLEDAGYFCVDNLPPELLQELIALQYQRGTERMAVAIDARSVRSLPALAGVLEQLQAKGVQVQQLFLDASDEVLVRRFSETRRRHPLSGSHLDAGDMSVLQAIAAERQLLQSIREAEKVHVLDTSHLRSAQLLDHIKQFLSRGSDSLTVVLQSFGFKHGLPLDANFVFDVRMLPNPFYETALRPLTGRDAAVAQYLAEHESVQQMQAHILAFLQPWLPAMAAEHRSYVNVAIGCTGGQHRSVYLVEQLHTALSADWPSIKRHRELSV